MFKVKPGQPRQWNVSSEGNKSHKGFAHCVAGREVMYAGVGRSKVVLIELGK